ncbi:cytochrome P450 76A1-like [Gastrolobium bilobum]|uniref:cytochrome P450 76A1-like n=1 Tax=Gastrolobium bilobum TaxID=150636 RepID=UPI002AB221B9|nr:cytochrome P450 76A1-like [Gastrolobium bilobum]
MVWFSDYPPLFLLLSSFPLLLFIYSYRRRKISASNRRLPPGPPGWPIFGNMFQLGEMPHRTLTNLREKYGPVVWLQIGAINTMVILSTKAATVFFKNHDHNFADRTITQTMRVHNYDKSSLALAPYGTYWRIMRRLVTVDMLVTKRINDTASVRRRCVDDMLSWVAKEARELEDGRGVHVARFVFLMTFNLLGNLMLSRDLFDPESKDGSEFFTAMMGLMEWGGHPNVTDLFPWLRWLDPQGLKKKMDRDMGIALGIASRFVKERLEEQRDNNSRDFLDVLLEFQNSESQEAHNISNKDLNIFILEIFLAGSETTSSTIEWALTELLCNRECMMKVKKELGSVVGSAREFEESDIDNLPYLQCVVKETFRMHPPIPLLVPRRAIQDTEFMGYDIPKDTQVFVNAWAIGRDPDVWDEPLAFKPERFLGSGTEYKGQHYELIPFGAGRRMCAGVPLAHRVLHLVLGSLLHRFDWELDNRVTPSTMDMKDRLGITMRKFEPLLAVPKLIGS